MDQPLVDESIESVDRGTFDYLRRHSIYVVVILSFTVIIFVIGFLSLYYGVTDFSSAVFPSAVLMVGLILWYSVVKQDIQKEFMRQFAAANGYTYSDACSLKGFDGSLFQVGEDKYAYNVVDGQYKNYPISLINYFYATGSGKSKETHNYTIFRLQFDAIMPDIILESAGHFFGGSLFDKLPGKNMVKLEGDFNKYLSLCVPKGYEIEALEIFTPDVMEEIIEKTKSLSLEIINSHLFIYKRGMISTKKDLYAVYGLVQYFIEKIGLVLSRMKPSLEAMKEYQEKTS